MRDSWLKFDTIVAVCALLMSTVTAGAMVYQTRVIAEQFSATVWPYLNMETTYSPNEIDIGLANQGAGPALIRSASLAIDGRAAAGWGDLVDIIKKEASVKRTRTVALHMSSVDASTAIRPGDTRSLISLKTNDKRIVASARRHRITIDLCYCSINGQCWTLHNALDSTTVSIPQTARSCPIGAWINSPANV